MIISIIVAISTAITAWQQYSIRKLSKLTQQVRNESTYLHELYNSALKELRTSVSNAHTRLEKLDDSIDSKMGSVLDASMQAADKIAKVVSHAGDSRIREYLDTQIAAIVQGQTGIRDQ